MDNRLVIRLTKSVGNIASLFTLPSIGALYTEILETEKKSFSTYLYNIIDFLKIGFPVYADHMTESMTNDIGEQTLVSAMGTDAGTLQKVADNIVPQPRMWTLHGYIGYSDDNLFASVGYSEIITIIKKFGRGTLLTVLKEYIRFLANARRPFHFNTSEGESVPAFIKSFKFNNVAENINFVEVDLEIQEFRYVALQNGGIGQSVGGAYSYGFSKTAYSMGRVAAKTLFVR
jgi:hypothetical protein